MPRLARVVVPGIPHHVCQRGNRGQETFFCDEDYEAYLELMAQWCGECGVEVWAYCLMPNHVHLIAVPAVEAALCRGIGEAHRRYTRRVNFREGWRGHLWQGRFSSYPMDEAYLYAAARYVELNPVRAKLVSSPQAYRWSSTGAHLTGKADVLVKVAPLLDRFGNWREFLSTGLDEEAATLLRRHEHTGRPLGSPEFVARLEKLLNRALAPCKPGRKAKPKRKAQSPRVDARRNA